MRWLVAVQGQEWAEAKWSLAERTRGCTDADVEAAFDRGEFLRTHLLRPTWHLVAREEVRRLLRLTRPRVHALNRFMYRTCELDGQLLARTHDVLARALAADGPRTRAELAAALGAAGIEASGHRLGYVLMHAELEELVASGPRRGRQQTYALLDDRAPAAAADDAPREAVLDDLVLRWFRARGPATIADFTTWSSLTVAETRAALDRVGGELAREDDVSGTAWYGASGPFVAPRRAAPRAFLVPMFDEMTIGYRDLRVVLADPVPRPGLLERPIVIDGRTVGSWRRELARRSVAVTARLFGPLDAEELAALEAAVERFGRFLGLAPSLDARVVA